MKDNSQAAAPETSALVPDENGTGATQRRVAARRGLYLIPNLMTTGSLFSGLYAIIAGMNGRFEGAAIAIFIGLALDVLDGRVARLTNTSTPFGAEYDSLSDMVTFGVAPSLVMFNWALSLLNQIGWAVAFAYTACAALRLARFNTQTADKRFFAGLASPLAAAVVAGTVWVGQTAEVGIGLSMLAAFITVCAGVLMVSNIRYQSFKGIDFKGRVPYVAVLIIISLFTVIAINPPVVLLSMAIIYASSGPLASMWHWVKRNAASKAS